MGADRILILSIVLLFVSIDLRKVSANGRIPSTIHTGRRRASWRHLPPISTLRNVDSQPMDHLGTEDYEDYAFSSSQVQMMSSSSSETSSSPAALPSKQQMQKSSNDSSLWPPWPFNLITNQSDGGQKMNVPKTKGDDEQYQSGAGMFFVYFREKMRVSLRQMQTVGSALSFHLPQSAPPLFALALLPAPTVAEGTSTGVFLSNAHGFCRKLALASLGIAVLSWADYEVRNTKRLTPLPLDARYKDIKKAISILPPFLPEAVTPIEFDPVLGSSSVGNDESMNIIQNTARDNSNLNNTITDTSSVDGNTNNDSSMNTNGDPSPWFTPEGTFQVTKSIKNVYNDIQVPGLDSIGHMINGWQKMVRLRQRELEEYKRKKVIDELLSLQQTRKQQKKKAQFSLTEAAKNAAKNAANKVQTRAHIHTQDPSSLSKSDELKQQVAPLGYALVTGASRGIGRALAVELARWQIPLILVARDLNKLTNVADEIEAGYGVNVVCIQADLSDPNAARQVHEATNKARLHVDILVNNAGICTNGDVVDSDEDEICNMVNINVGSVTTLSHLYSKDMKRKRRGRMLFVSSVVGATPGGPGIAAYAATKAYEKSFAMSIGRELEKYGVGVTCIMPGAVKGTSFAARSKVEDAICWKFPFYPMTAPDVASRGIRAMLLGDAEVIPGWHNRLFLKMLSPLLPQRISTSVVGFSFSPLRLGVPSLPWKVKRTNANELEEEAPRDFYRIRPPPRILNLSGNNNANSSWRDSLSSLNSNIVDSHPDEPKAELESQSQSEIDGNAAELQETPRNDKANEESSLD